MARLVLIALPVAAERQASAAAMRWIQPPGYRDKAWDTGNGDWPVMPSAELLAADKRR